MRLSHARVKQQCEGWGRGGECEAVGRAERSKQQLLLVQIEVLPAILCKECHFHIHKQHSSNSDRVKGLPFSAK